MGLIEAGIRSLETLHLSQSPKLRPLESMPGPNNADGRRLRWFPDRTLRIRQITNAREPPMICNCQSCMYSGDRLEGFFISGGLNFRGIIWTRCGRIGISWTIRQRVARTFPLR